MQSVYAALRRFRPLIAFVALLWAVHVLNIATGNALTRDYGLIPRTVEGLDGVLLMPLLHGSWQHLSANTPPLLVLGGLILLLAPQRFWKATIICILVGGVLTWLLARPNNHIGASLLIFGWFGFLVALGVLERSAEALFGAAIALLLYGVPTFLGVVPGEDGQVSWDGHLAGLVAGVSAAVILRKRRRTGGRVNSRSIR
ncbi:MAG: rhomboid family intramembrane serine protease [Pseudomonadota bacterium]